MALFLTGATGFIGGALARRLLSRGETLHLLVRPGSKLVIDHPRIRVFRGGLEDVAVLRKGMEGCDAAFHLAAWVRLASEDPLLFDRTNVEGTRRFIEAASLEGIRKIVYTSSVIAIGPSGGAIANEETVRRTPFLTDYERTKTAAEEEMIKSAEKGFPVVIASPSLVFGPTDSLKRYSFNRFLLDFITGRLLAIPGDGMQVINAVYIDDVVEGHLLALEKGRAGERYILGGENTTLGGLAELVLRSLGKKRRLVHLPLPLLKGLSWLEVAISKMRRCEPRLTPGSIEIYRHHWAYSSDKARSELGYRPITLKEGIERVLAWALLERNRLKNDRTIA